MLSADRQQVLSKIEELEINGQFDLDAEIDPPGRVIMPGEVDYLRKKFSSKIKSHYAYFMARRFLNKLLKSKQLMVEKINGLDNFKNLTTGAIITCNHFSPLDSFATQVVYEASLKKGKFYRVIREGNYTSFPGFYGMIMRHCNTLPLSSNKDTMKEFLVAVDTLLRQGNYVLVYPEQSLWWNYRKPKPLKKSAFKIAAVANVPVLPIFITMKDSNIIASDGSFVQKYTINIGKPIYADSHQNPSENAIKMLKQNEIFMKETYERFYQQPLIYSTKSDQE